MFIQTEETPNPNALKFLPGLDISPKSPVFFNNFDEARAKSPLAAKLYDIGNIEAVFLGADFITVTKTPVIEWKLLILGSCIVFVQRFPLAGDIN